MGRSVSTPSGARVVAYDYLEYEEDYDDWTYPDFIEDIAAVAEDLWPSFRPVKKWAGREDRVLLENGFAQLGVSEYCGLVAIWVMPRGDVDCEALAIRWIDQIAPRFNDLFGKLDKMGTASNGESFFRERA